MSPLPLLLGILLLSGLASAQDDAMPSLAVAPPEGPLAPGAAPSALPVTVLVPCAWLGAEDAARVRFLAPEAPPGRASWVRANVTPAEAATEPGACAAGETASASARLEVAFTDEAPALTPVALRVRALVEAGNRSHALAEDVPVEAAFVGRLEVRALETSKTGKPQSTLTFPIVVSNLGNQRTKVFFTIEENDGGLNVPVPMPVVLESRQTGGGATEATIPLQVLTPYRNGYLNETARIVLRVESAYVLDPKLKGDAAEVELEVRTVGAYVPAPALPTALAAAAAVALAARAALRTGRR